MEVPSVTSRAAKLLGAGAVAATVAVGVLLRLVDPLSSAVLPAEDPFTHMVLVGEHLRTGTLEPLNDPGGLYPPGMHALVAAVWSFTGFDLYQIFRWGPVALGGVGVLGMATLLWREAGPIAGFVGGLGFAVAPEIIFRTTMMSPTALDMALLPFLLYALLQVAGGETRWLGAAAPMTAFVLFAHPWLFGLLSVAGLAFVALSLLLPWPGSRSPTPSPTGLAWILALLGTGLGLGMTGCAGYCGPGFDSLLPGFLTADWIAALVVLASLAPVAILSASATASSRVARLLPDDGGDRLPGWAKGALSLILAGVLLQLTMPAVRQGMPELVDLPRMFGWPILAVAGFAFVALPFLSSRAAHLGVGLGLATYPLVIYNPFESPFWPHRTAVFLGVGLVILLGVTARSLASWTTEALEAAELPLPSRERWEATHSLLLAPALLVAATVGGAVYTGTPDGYEDGWYRLYGECEFEAMGEIAETSQRAPSSVVATGSWQSRLVLASLDGNASSIWAKPSLFTSERVRDQVVGGLEQADRPLFVVVERHLSDRHPNADASFLDGDAWTREDTWCGEDATGSTSVTLYRYDGGPR